jgi:transposase InsO family protein
VIGWAMDDHLRAELVLAAVTMGVVLRGQLAQTVILHADRGCQYTSEQLPRFTGEHNLIRSVGTTLRLNPSGPL